MYGSASREPASIPAVHHRILNVAAHVVNLVVSGASSILCNGDTPIAWKYDLEQIKPKLNQSIYHGPELIDSLEQYVKATSERNWHARFLLGCSLLHDLWGKQKQITNGRAHKALARIVLSMLDALFDQVGETAFKAPTALFGKHKTLSY